MGLIDLIKGLWQTEQTHWAHVEIKPPGPSGLENAVAYGTAIKAHQAYLTVTMRSMSIPAVRKGWTLFHGAIYTQASVGLRNGTVAQIRSVLSPDFMRALDPKKLQNVLHVDRTILGPVPFCGAKISLETGVVSVKDADLAAPFLSTLTDLAKTAGVAMVTAAAPFIEPIKNGMEMLTGTKDATSVEVALCTDLNPPRTAWYALINRPQKDVVAADLSVRPGNLELLERGEPLGGQAYLLYSVDATTTRPDWAQIPELKAAYDEFALAVDGNNQIEAKSAVEHFRRRALLSPELLRSHAPDIVKEIEQDLAAAFPGGAVARGSTDVLNRKTLADLKVTFSDPH